MIKFSIEDKEFEMISSYGEMKLKHLVKISGVKKTDDPNDLDPVLDLISILSNTDKSELEEMTLTMLTELAGQLVFLNEELPKSTENPIVINGIDYVVKEDMNDLTMGEYSSIKILQEKFPDSHMDQMPWILATLVRPGTKTIKNETGKVKWKQDKFNSDDLEDRVNIFMENLPVKYISGVTGFFLNMNNK
jgi:hypothetical protein